MCRRRIRRRQKYNLPFNQFIYWNILYSVFYGGKIEDDATQISLLRNSRKYVIKYVNKISQNIIAKDHQKINSHEKCERIYENINLVRVEINNDKCPTRRNIFFVLPFKVLFLHIPLNFLPLFQQIFFQTARCAKLVTLFFQFTFLPALITTEYRCLYSIHIYAAMVSNLYNFYHVQNILCDQ